MNRARALSREPHGLIPRGPAAFRGEGQRFSRVWRPPSEHSGLFSISAAFLKRASCHLCLKEEEMELWGKAQGV